MPSGKLPLAPDLPRPASWLDQPGVSKQDGAYEALRAAILGKTLPAGSRLPSSRTLAARWKLSRGTIETVFDRLHAQAYVTRVPGSGTRVCAVVPERFLMAGFALPGQRAADASAALPQPLPDTGVRDALAFVAGRADAALFSTASWSRCAARALAAATPAQLCGADPAGAPELRRQIADYLAKYRGIRCDPQDIVITTGIGHALDLVARATVRPGDKVCLEDPGYPAARTLFTLAGAVPVDIAVDAEGIDCAALQAHADASLVYVTPAHQSPLGVTMSVTRRLALLDWASDNGAWVVEDDYDSEFNYQSAPLAALKSLDQYQRVIYCGSFNKTLFAGLRLGFMVLPPGLRPLLLRTLQRDRPLGGHDGPAGAGRLDGGKRLCAPSAPGAPGLQGAARPAAGLPGTTGAWPLQLFWPASRFSFRAVAAARQRRSGFLRARRAGRAGAAGAGRILPAGAFAAGRADRLHGPEPARRSGWRRRNWRSLLLQI